MKRKTWILAIGTALLFWILFFFILFGCSQKVNTPHRSVDDRLRGVEMPVPSKDTIKKKYRKSLAPVKAHKPHVK